MRSVPYIYNERSRVLPKSPIGVAFEYCANRWISLQNYLKGGYGDPLLMLKKKINWELFRPLLEDIFRKEEKGIGGRTPYEYLLMFKILILQRYIRCIGKIRAASQIGLMNLTYNLFRYIQLQIPLPYY